MGIKLLPSGSLLETILNNPNAQTSTDGVQAPRGQQTPASTISDNRSSYNQPQQRNAAVLPPSGVVDAITSGSQTLGVPSGYQSVVRSAVSGAITTVLQTSQSQTGNTDIGSNQYRGNVATRLFSGVRGFIASTAPTFGVSANSGPLSSGLAVLANSAINLGKNSVVQKYGTAILNAQQYAVFGTAVLNSFHSAFDNLPEVKQAGTIKSVVDLIGGSTSPELVQQATQTIQQGIRLQPPNAPVSTNNSIGNEGLPQPHTYKVYLESSINASELFVFKTQPIINISESAQYSEFSPLHAPGHILAYKNSPARTFSVSDIKLISRNASEAQHNLQMLTLLRSWTKPYFGRSHTQGPNQSDFGSEPTSESAQIAAKRILAREQRAVDAANAVANASEISKLLRRHPAPVPVEYIDYALNTFDPMNGTLLPISNLPATAAASACTATSVTAAVVNPILSKTATNISRIDGKQSSTTPRLLDSTTTAMQTTPITPSAANAIAPSKEVLNSSIGSPPPVLYFYGYSEDGITATNTVQNIRRVPVCVASVGFNYPNDVDYIPTLDGVPFPTVMSITLELKETKAPYEIEQFSLADFKAGKLIGW